MSNFILNRVVIGDKTVVRYLMKQKCGNVTGCTSPESALWMLTNDKAKKPRMSDEFPGYPLTADGVYFFDGAMGEGETVGTTSSGADVPPSPEGDTTSSVTADAVPPSPEGEGSGATAACGKDWCEIPAEELGGDGLPMPAGAEKPRRKKRIKDFVCE